jgi:hypothetical protein
MPPFVGMEPGLRAPLGPWTHAFPCGVVPKPACFGYRTRETNLGRRRTRMDVRLTQFSHGGG